MSTLQVANLHFESTGNNRIQYFGANNFAFVVSGANCFTVNSTSSPFSNGVTTTIGVGYTVAPYNLGTLSSGSTTLNPALGNYQYYTNNGAHTITAPSSDCAIDILITNGASAGSITFSGFTVGASTGSTYVTTNTNRFVLSVRRINGVSTYSWYALQ
jgi:hypothetical protein